MLCTKIINDNKSIQKLQLQPKWVEAIDLMKHMQEKRKTSINHTETCAYLSHTKKQRNIIW